jgi:phage terminase small subunit
VNPRQQAFATQYLQDSNATQAAIRAGYSKKTAKSQGARLLTHVDVAAFIKSQQTKTAEAVELSQKYVLDGLMGIADDEDSAVSSRVRAYELLGKHQGMFSDKLEVSEIPSKTLVREWIDAITDDIESLD